MTLKEDLCKVGLYADIEYLKKAAKHLAQQAIELEIEGLVSEKKYKQTEGKSNQQNSIQNRI